MCYLVREQQAATADGAAGPVPPSFDRVRPRWAGVAGAVLVGGLALAALVAPRSAANLAQVKASAAPAPIAARADKLPTAAGGNQTSLPMDDGVPTAASETPQAGLGHCHHGM
jgi:hypothetical protein